MANNPTLLYVIPEVNAYQMENSQERLLTSQGFQTMSLIMVPVTSTTSSEDTSQLQLSLAPDLDIKLTPATRVHFQSPRSYLISRPDTRSSNEYSLRIEFPLQGQRKGADEDMETFESILAQCNVHIQHSLPTLPPYDPSQYKLGNEMHKHENSSSQGQIVIVDEDNGSVLGELGSGFKVIEDSQMKPGTNGPVEITLPADDSGKIRVSPATESYLGLATHPVYKNSKIVSKATMASRFIVTTSDYMTKTLQSQADSFTQKTKPSAKPLKFEPATHDCIRKACHITENAAGLSAKTVRQVQKYAQNIGASVSKRDKSHAKAKAGLVGPDGNPSNSYKPGLLNQSLVAFSTIADGIDQAGRSMLSGTSTAVSTVVGHRYGHEAGEITKNIGGGVRNVGLVYIDATGISRRAIVKSVVKGMVVGKLPDGGNLIVGGEVDEKKTPSMNPEKSTTAPDYSQYQMNMPKFSNKEQENIVDSSHFVIPKPPPPPRNKFDDSAPPPAYTPGVTGSN